VELRPSTFGRRQNLIGLYVEDQFTPLPDLTVTTGLRYDYDSLTEGGGGADAADYNNLAPRLSLNYALDARTTLRGGYGIFYDKIVYAVTSDALESNSNDPAFKSDIRTLVEKGILPEDTDIDEVTFNGTRSAQRDGAVGYLQRPSDVTPLSGGRRILNPNGYENPRRISSRLASSGSLGTRGSRMWTSSTPARTTSSASASSTPPSLTTSPPRIWKRPTIHQVLCVSRGQPTRRGPSPAGGASP